MTSNQSKSTCGSQQPQLRSEVSCSEAYCSFNQSQKLCTMSHIMMQVLKMLSRDVIMYRLLQMQSLRAFDGALTSNNCNVRWMSMVDSRLHPTLPRCTTHNEYLRLFIVKQNTVGISAVMAAEFYHCSGIHMMCHRAIMWKHDVIHKTRSTQCITTPSQEDRFTSAGNRHKKKFDHVVFSLCEWTDNHTNIQIDILITILCIPPGAKKKYEAKLIMTVIWWNKTSINCWDLCCQSAVFHYAVLPSHLWRWNADYWTRSD